MMKPKTLILRNDWERSNFLKDYTNVENGWYLWQENPVIQRRWWRRDIGNCSIVIEDALHRNTFPYGSYEGQDMWSILHVYLVTEWALPLENGTSFMSKVKDWLKTETRNGRAI